VQRKVFLQKNLPKGKHSFLKLFLWSAVALIILVIVTPMITRHKGTKEASRKPIPEKSGMVVKEIPRSVPPVAENAAVGEGEDRVLNETTPIVASAPEGASQAQEPVSEPAPPLERNIQVDVSPQKAPDTTDAQQKEHAAELAKAQPTFGQQVFKDTNAAAKPDAAPPVDTKEKPAPPPPATKSERPPLMGPGAKQRSAAVAGQKQSKPASGDAALFSLPGSTSADSRKVAAKKTEPKKTDLEKKSTDSGGLVFTVQVGSFKEKHNAEEMQQNLRKKGYDAVLKPMVHPSLGQLYVVQLQPVSDVSKASTLMMQIKHEEKVKPVILKTVQGQ
jgi:cell division protein FtsN